MDLHRRCIRAGSAAICAALVMRLIWGGFPSALGKALENPETASFLVYLATGRVCRLSGPAPEPAGPPLPPETEPPPSTLPPPELPSFSRTDLEAVELTRACSYEPDLPALLEQPLAWDLTGHPPAVLILHTHATESYTKLGSDDYEETSPYRTLDPAHSVVCLGELVARRLEAAGIPVYHDRGLHDYPSFNSAYLDAAASTEEILRQHPEIRLILDLHRDAADTPTGQLVTECAIGGETAAQLMLVVGTDDGGLAHPEWRENLSLALKLQVLLERSHPGICRPLHLTYNRYNQHLGGHALLVEIGAAGNTLAQAKPAAAALADAVIALKNGSS